MNEHLVNHRVDLIKFILLHRKAADFCMLWVHPTDNLTSRVHKFFDNVDIANMPYQFWDFCAALVYCMSC